jgi:hypothetical protein
MLRAIGQAPIDWAKPTLCLTAGCTYGSCALRLRQRQRERVTSRDDIMTKYCTAIEEPLVPTLKTTVFRAASFSQDVVG